MKILTFCFLSFFISFLLYTGIALINGIFYEHFLYLPLVFFFTFFILITFALSERVRGSGLAKAAVIIWLILLTGRNFARQLDWTDAVRFYSQTLTHAPNSVRIRNGLGMAYADRGDFDAAIKEYQSAIEKDPSVPNLYHNLANAYAAKGDLQNAEKYYLKAIEVDPKFLFSYQSLMDLYRQTGNVKGLQMIEKSLPGAYNNP